MIPLVCLIFVFKIVFCNKRPDITAYGTTVGPFFNRPENQRKMHSNENVENIDWNYKFQLCLTVQGYQWDCNYIGFQPGQVNMGRLSFHEVFDVYCTDDLWTVIQSRGQFGNPEDYFYRGWHEYEQGFGVPGTSLGNIQ